MSILTITNIVKIYKKQRIINKINLQIKSGEIIGLLGPNGAGKTTIFYIIIGIIQHDSGEIILDNTNINNLSIHYRSRLGIGYLPQESSIFRKMSVFNNLKAISEIHNKINKENQNKYICKLMKEFNIIHLSNKIGYSLSGGEKRKVEIARALIANPKFILLDEPFAGIDPLSIINIKNIIQKLCQKGLGILITDHNVRDTLSICNKAYIINQGNVIADGTAEEILNNKQVQRVYLGKTFNI